MNDNSPQVNAITIDKEIGEVKFASVHDIESLKNEIERVLKTGKGEYLIIDSIPDIGYPDDIPAEHTDKIREAIAAASVPTKCLDDITFSGLTPGEPFIFRDMSFPFRK